MPVAVEVRPADPGWVVTFVNEYGSAPRREAGEQEESYPALEALGEHDPALTSGLSELRLVAVADRLHRLFVASCPEEVAEVLNGLLKSSNPTPRVRAGVDGYERPWSVRGAAEVPLTAACALTLLEELDSSRRLGVCRAERCVDVFVDRSPSGGRRYCSSLCHNRAKVNAFRRRQKQSGIPRTK